MEHSKRHLLSPQEAGTTNLHSSKPHYWPDQKVNGISILFVNPIRLIGEIVARALEGEPEVARVKIATNVEEARELLCTDQFDVALIHAHLPQGSALALTSYATEHCTSTKTLIIGLAESQALILSYIEAGAVGYLSCEESADMLVEYIHAVVEGKALISPEVTAMLMQHMSGLTATLDHVGVETDHYDELTPREREVLDLIGSGLTNQEIADQLTVEVGTVKNHVHNVLRKLNVSNRQDAAILLSLVEDGAD